MEYKVNKFEKEHYSSQVKGMTSKKDVDKMMEFKTILDNANSHYQMNLSNERELRRGVEFEIEKLKREIEIRGEGKNNKGMQTVLKWTEGDAPVKSTYW